MLKPLSTSTSTRSASSARTASRHAASFASVSTARENSSERSPKYTSSGRAMSPFKAGPRAGNGAHIVSLGGFVAGGSTMSSFGRSPCPASARSVRTRAGQLEADQTALLALHRRPVVVPVGVLTGYALVVVDQRLHRLREREDRNRALDLDPRSVEPVREHAEPAPTLPAEVAHLVRRLAA